MYDARRTAGLLLLAVTVTACTATAPGSPSAGPSAITTTGTSGPALPPRPREIRLDAVDPCKLWTADQLRQLALVSEPRKDTSTAGDAMCSYDTQGGPRNSSLSVLTVVDHDVTDGLDASRGDKIVQVAGFPAVQQTAEAGSVRPCVVMVSTAQGQFLEFRLNYGSVEDHPTIEQACRLTTTAAEFAMQTLLGQR